MKISRRARSIGQSEIRSMTLECRKSGGINLAQGIADLPAPEAVKEGARKAITGNTNSYTRYDGIDSVRKAVAGKMKRYNGLDVDPEGEIIVSSGATGAFYIAAMVLLEPGDECLVFEPCYGYHINTLASLGALPKYIRMQEPDWTFSMDDLEAAVTEKTKAIMINTPANPSGKVFTEEELKDLAEFAVAHDLVVFTDEIYEYFLYDGNRHISPATFENIRDRTVTIGGYSKTFYITGWRLGYIICSNREWIDAMGHLNDLIYVCAPAPLQAGVAAGIESIDDDWYRETGRLYQKKRDFICEALAGIGLAPCIPGGAYYILADVSSLPGETSMEKAMHILHKTGVATVPGSAFYHDRGGENLVRICFAREDAILEEAVRRLGDL